MFVSEERAQNWKTCDVCGDSYDSLAGIACHLRNTGHGEYDKFATVSCHHCGDEFEAKKSLLLNERNGKYCSDECHYEAKRDQVTVTCKNCGDEFETNRHDAEERGRRYCSQECMGEDPDFGDSISEAKRERMENDPEFREKLKRQGKEVGELSPDEETKQKRLNTIRERYDDNQIIEWARQGGNAAGEPWNKGLTKEDDDRLRSAAEKLTGHEPFPGSGWGKDGFREDVGHFVRSTWEANVARVYQHMDWDYEYEPDSFELGDGSTYRPDFYLPRFGWYVEVSGYVSDEKRWKVNQFREFHGDLKHMTKPAYDQMCEGFTNELGLE